MSAIITSDLIEALSQCRRKAFFICRAEPIGVEHEYVQIMRLRESRSPRQNFETLLLASDQTLTTKRRGSSSVPTVCWRQGICGPTVMPCHRPKERHRIAIQLTSLISQSGLIPSRGSKGSA